MRYMGGKFRQGKVIAKFAHHVLTPNKIYVEPFCGALGAASRVAHNRMILNDICKPLILMWKGLYEGTITLPQRVTEEEYNEYKHKRDMDDWMTAYCGFGMSFGGKWFGGLARDHRVNDPVQYAVDCNNGLISERIARINKSITRKVEDVSFSDVSFSDVSFSDNSVVYCDPPYTKRTKAHAHEGDFNTEEFWDWCRSQVMDRSIPLLATSFIIPSDFKVLHSWGDTVVRHHAGKGSDETNEVLCCHRTQAKLFAGLNKEI